MPYLPYEEARITTILSLTSFLLLLNGARYIFDRLLYCGIVGEILIGIIWGLPVGGTAWLSEGTQETIQAFGYLGLIGLVFEGGLSTDIASLRRNAYASVSVATIGLLMPIALSFLLLVFPFSGGTAYPTPLAAFSAGASLCSTSLGTTFAILSTANMQKTRVGVVLVGAAMMDDVVGLVMVNIVTTLGRGGIAGWPIARPIAASSGLFIVTLAICPYVLRPIWQWLLGVLHGGAQLDTPANWSPNIRTTISKIIRTTPHLRFVLSIAVLITFVTVASFIDASVLFAAFIAGGVLSFLWAASNEQPQSRTTLHNGPMQMYEEYLKPVMGCVLVPFFFISYYDGYQPLTIWPFDDSSGHAKTQISPASIGFSIPITDMFNGSIVWKGIVYSVLMIFAKGMVSTVLYFEYFVKKWKTRKPIIRWRKHISPSQPDSIQMRSTLPANTTDSAPSSEQSTGPPHSTALLVGLAMVARGEIGFLIASLSQSSGTLTLRRKNSMENESSGEELFLVIVWAVVICTIVGPLGVGIIVRRIRARVPDFG